MSKKLALCVFLSSNLLAHSFSFDGISGAYKTPNARTQKDWHLGFFYAHDNANIYGAFLSPLPFFEFSFSGSKSKSHTQKSVNAKILLSPEQSFAPALAVGVNDFWGYGGQTYKYLVLSKKISYFDLSFGYMRENKKYFGYKNNALRFLKDPSWKSGDVFASAIFKANRYFDLLGEYMPSQKGIDGNFGLKIYPFDGASLSLMYGGEHSFKVGLAYSFNLSNIRKLEPYKKTFSKKLLSIESPSMEKHSMEDLALELSKDYANVRVYEDKDKLFVKLENEKYSSLISASGRAQESISRLSDERYESLYLSLKEGARTQNYKLNHKESKAFFDEKVSSAYMSKALQKIDKDEFNFSEANKTKLYSPKRFDPFIGAKIASAFEPFGVKASLSAGVDVRLFDGMFLLSQASLPFYNGFKSKSAKTIENEAKTIRSDELDYLAHNELELDKLALSYFFPLGSQARFYGELGYVDGRFFALDANVQKDLFDGLFAVGVEYQIGKKREIEQLFGLKDELVQAGFVNISKFIHPPYGLSANVKLGRFLAGDWGGRVDISRLYKGLKIGAYIGYSNSKDVFKHPSNKNYVNAGLYFHLPLNAYKYGFLRFQSDFNFKARYLDAVEFVEIDYKRAYPENSSAYFRQNIRQMKR